MEGAVCAGMFMAPNGDCVRVLLTYLHQWSCVIVPRAGHPVTTCGLSLEFWRALVP